MAARQANSTESTPGVSNVAGSYVIKKKNTKSCVWKEFGIRSDEKGKVIESEKERPMCGKGVQAKGSNTTNLFQHLRDNHPAIYSQLAPEILSKRGDCHPDKQPSMVQLTLQETPKRLGKYSAHSSEAKELNKAVTYYIAKDAMPVFTVTKPGFKHLLSKLNPRYEVPSRKHFTEHEIPSLYSDIRDNKVQPAVTKASFFSGTTDLWTSGSCDPYLTFTIHFVDASWNLTSNCLDTVPLYADHTGANIAETTTDILENWNLDVTRLVAMTTDNGSNVVAAYRNLNILRVSCFGHNLDLAIKKGLDIQQVHRALARCHSLVELFHRSWKKTRDLREKQRQLDLPQHKIMGDVSTRWGSTFSMISRILEQQQAISAVIADERKYWHKMMLNLQLWKLFMMYLSHCQV